MSNVTKSARISKAFAPDDAAMAAINAQALEPLGPGDVFTFRVAMCDTRVDRDFERFTRAALEEMAPLFVGKTVVKDHQHRSDNQVARIYEAHVEDLDGYSALVGSAYMLDSPANAGLIADIRGGIRREVSVGVALSHAVCSVCGTDNVKRYCEHVPGRDYGGEACTFELSGVVDAYEMSFVAVPAQRGAGVTKSYRPGDEVPRGDGRDPSGEDRHEGGGRARELALRVRAAGAWALARAGEAAL